jgi:predicted RND superfamily exporter protein
MTTAAAGTRWPRLLVGLLVLAAAALLTVLGLSRVTTDTTTASFLPTGDATQRASLEAARAFGGDPVVVLAESAQPRGLLGPDELPRLVGLEGALAQLPDVAVVYGPGTVLNQVAGAAQNLLATISGKRDALRAAGESKARAAGGTPAQVRRAGDDAVRAFDLRYGSLLVRGLPAGLPTLRNPSFVNAVVFDKDGAPRQQWRFVVPAPDAVVILVRPREELDQAGTERLVQAVRDTVKQAGLATDKVTVTGMPAVAADLGGVLRREIPLLGGAAVALIGACYLLLPWLAPRRRRLLPLVATFAATAVTLSLFGWLDHPVSLGVVAFLPILVGTGSDFPAYLLRGADRRRVAVTALAGAAGFASLALSPMPFVRDLGLALAVGVLLAVVFGLLISRRATPVQAAASPVPTAARPLRQRLVLLSVAAGIAVTGWVELPHLHVEARPEHLAQGVAALDDATYAEGVLGSAGEVQVLVQSDDVLTPESLDWMRRAEDVTIRQYGDRLRPIVSLPSLLAFLGDDPTQEQILAGLAQLPRYLGGAVVRDDGQVAVLSFGIKLDDVGAQRDLLDQLRASLPPTLPGMSVDLAGLPVATARGYALAFDHRYLPGLVGICAAGLVLLLGLPRRSDALRAVLSAALATGWGFAGAWLLGVPLTPLTVSLGSLATATACEFSVLLGDARRFVGLGRSVMVAAAAATAGYLALVLSGLAVVRDFGLFLAATVLLSLVAAHVVRLLLPEQRPARSPIPASLPKPTLEVSV